MIVRMAKVEIAGPREELTAVLGHLQSEAVLQLDRGMDGFVDHGCESCVHAFEPDKAMLARRLHIEEIRDKTRRILACIEGYPAGQGVVEPSTMVESLAYAADEHASYCDGLAGRLASLRQEAERLARLHVFLEALVPLVEGMPKSSGLELVGFTVGDGHVIAAMTEMLDAMTAGGYSLNTARCNDGSIAGIIAVSRDHGDALRHALGQRSVAEMPFPPEFENLSFAERLRRVDELLAGTRDGLAQCEAELARFAWRWKAIYERLLDWTAGQLALFGAASCVCQTELCFLIHGWMPSSQVRPVRSSLQRRFGDVALRVVEIGEEEMGRVPVALRNNAYFRPFERFTRVIPLPAYSSIDPTPLLGVFFPLFFGMILGDAGYGLVLAVVAMLLVRSATPVVADGARILLVCSLYAAVFGVLFGEFFGDSGTLVAFRDSLPLVHHLAIDRRHAIMPMLVFALATGMFHVLLGLAIGAAGDIRHRRRRHAVLKLLDIVIVVIVVAILCSLGNIGPQLPVRPLVIAVVALIPFVLVAGGLLAPLELLKIFGNIVSYARIMAVGLTSVILAWIANETAGTAGNILVAVVAGGLLHLINIAIGVFSPAIHALRLHYVEFFGQFMEPGGRTFTPFGGTERK